MHQVWRKDIVDWDTDGVALRPFPRSPVRVHDAGEEIYAQGDPSGRYFHLLTGWVSLHRDTADGRRQITRFLLPGALFGVGPAGEEFSHTATAITKATISPISRAKFDEQRRRSPLLNEQFVAFLERELHHELESMTVLGRGSATERVGALLGELAVAAAGESQVRA
ncbi:MAG: Crp/Fnr family transcriptional regulator, partial [Phenylobacterium sp.]